MYIGFGVPRRPGGAGTYMPAAWKRQWGCQGAESIWLVVVGSLRRTEDGGEGDAENI